MKTLWSALFLFWTVPVLPRGDAGVYARFRARFVLNHGLHGVENGVKMRRVHPPHAALARIRFAFAPDVSYEMGFHVPSFVGHDGGQVGHVKWGGEEFTLPMLME